MTDPSESLCPKCGSRVRPDDETCARCGHGLAPRAPAEEPDFLDKEATAGAGGPLPPEPEDDDLLGPDDERGEKT